MPPESWHLSRVYTIIIQYTVIHFVRGTPIFRATQVSPGETPTFRAPGVSPGETPTFRAPQSRPRRPQGFGSLPISRPGLGETPYTTVDVFPMDSVLFNPIYPAWASIPLRLWGLTPTFRTLTNAVWVLPKQAHKSLYSKHGSLALLSVLLTYFPSFWNNTIHLIRSLIINTYRFPSIGRTLHNITLSHKHNRSALSKNTRQTEYFPLSPQGSPPVRRESPATTQGR